MKYIPKKFDGRLKHPFTCLVSGPTQAGKSTLIKKILNRRRRLINVDLTYITIFLGTPPEVNDAYVQLRAKEPTLIRLVDVNKRYPTKDILRDNFGPDIKAHIARHRNRPGLLIFDDLMSELKSSGSILTELFTKLSSHHNLSSIHITQNLFSKLGAGSTDHTTLYRNSQYIILFDSKLDRSVVSHVARRIAGPGRSKQVEDMLRDIMQRHRYVLIDGGFNTPKELQFRSAITADDPTPHQLVFQLSDDTSTP